MLFYPSHFHILKLEGGVIIFMYKVISSRFIRYVFINKVGVSFSLDMVGIDKW